MTAAPQRLRRGYFATPQGQVHYRRAGADAPGSTPLVCLHPTPFSSRFYAEFQEAAAAVATLALDTPGFGESDPITGDVTVEALARPLADALTAIDSPVDLLGFHTGCLLGLEIASTVPDRVRRVVLVDAPVLAPAERQAALARTLAAYEVRRKRFEALVEKRVSAGTEATIERELELLADEIAGSAAAAAVFTAAFRYEAEQRFDRVRQKVLCIATNGPLAGPTRTAAAQLPDARLEELSDVAAPVFQGHAMAVASVVLPFVNA